MVRNRSVECESGLGMPGTETRSIEHRGHRHWFLISIVLLLSAFSASDAGYDPILDYGIVDGYPEILWLRDHGDLTACCHNQGGFSRPYHVKAGIKARFDSVMSKRDFLYVFPSNYPDELAASSGGGDAIYGTICDNDISGVAHRLIGYRFCTIQDTMQGIISFTNMEHPGPWIDWLTASESVVRRIFLHELGHRWGAQCYTTVPDVIIGFSHWWGQRATVEHFEIASLMGGFPGSSTHFDDLDLYLMGLLPSSDVLDHDYVDPLGIHTPVTIESIVEATGVRDPAFPNAPQNFSLGFVVITPDTAQPRTIDLDKIEYWRTVLPTWWEVATGDRSQLTIDIASSVGGAVPDGAGVPGMPLTIATDASGDLVLSWEPSCGAGDTDYAVYEGTMGAYYNHVPRLCSTGGATTVTLSPGGGNSYYLVVPRTALVEGSYGSDSLGTTRPSGTSTCVPQALTTGCDP